MKSLRRTVLSVPLLLVVVCSFGDRIAGSKGGSETTNGITACILRKDGKPAVGSLVRLRKRDYVSDMSDNTVFSSGGIDAVTDRQGRFFICGVEQGDYCIEVNDTGKADGYGGAVLLKCSVGASDTIDFGTDSLRSYASVKGFIDTEDTGPEVCMVQVRGLERLARVDKNGIFTFNDLPPCTLDICIVKATGASTQPLREIINVKATSDDTATVVVEGQAAFSGYIYLDLPSLSSTVTGFPIPIRLDKSNFDFSRTTADAGDIGFTKADGSRLPYEIELWDREAGKAALWVRLDTIDHNHNKEFIIMNWGGADPTYRTDGSAVFDSAEGFAGVWHFSEDPTAGVIGNSTGKGYDGTPNGSMNGKNSVAGIIGNALFFDGKDDYVAAGILNLKGAYTLSLWINASDLGSARRFIWKEYSYTLWYDAIAGGIRVEHFVFQDSVAVWRGVYQDNSRSRLIPLDVDKWYYIAAAFDGDRIRCYINGEMADSTNSIGLPPVWSDQVLSLGGRKEEYVKGIMDEVRIENKARSDDWIRLCFVTQRPGGVEVKFRR